MVILTELQRDEAWAQFMAWLGTTHESVALNKQALRAAVADIDDGVDANLDMVDDFLEPSTAAGLSVAAKNYLFGMVVTRRLQEGI